jgi:hypothetical protein
LFTTSKGIKLPAAAILLIIRYWASWSDRPFIMGEVEDELNLTHKNIINCYS